MKKPIIHMLIKQNFEIPVLIMGSIVKVCPAFITPTALFPAWLRQKALKVQARKCMIYIYIQKLPYRTYLHNGEYLEHNEKAPQYHDRKLISPVGTIQNYYNLYAIS